MLGFSTILNESEARNAKASIAEIDRALSSECIFEPIIAGLPADVVTSFRRALEARRSKLSALLNAYDEAKAGDSSQLMRQAGSDPGTALIIGRIARGYSQKQLARLLGLKEQQIQRYESDRYRSISLSNYRRIAHILGVRWETRLPDKGHQWLSTGWALTTDVKAEEVKKIIKHAKEHHWFDNEEIELQDEESFSYLQRYISDQISSYGSPSLLRTGLNIEDHSNDLLLLAWKARVIRLAEQIIAQNKPTYNYLSLTWLRELVHLSAKADGPAHVRDFLLAQGILLVIEEQIPGLKLDGAAFLVDGTPVIGMTLRRDTLDNFWFTLLHETAHIVLHYQMGLSTGFFDDNDSPNVDEIESEADRFALNIFVPNEIWERSPVRIAKSPAGVEKFAADLRIHPAIVFGRLQKERGDYAIFSDKIGRGGVRKWLLSQD